MNKDERDIDKILVWVHDCVSGHKAPVDSEIEYLKTLKFTHGETLLHFSVVESLYPEVRFLLGRGWTCEVINERGSTPLVDAVRIEDERMVKLLLEHGADPNFPDKDGNIPLHHAFFDKNKPMIQLLTDYGSDIERKNIYGETPREF